MYYERMFSVLQDADAYHIAELSKRIQETIDELPISYKETFIMQRFHNISYKGIAEVLNVSPKTIDYRIQQALKILRIKLKEYLPFLLSLITIHILYN